MAKGRKNEMGGSPRQMRVKLDAEMRGKLKAARKIVGDRPMNTWVRKVVLEKFFEVRPEELSEYKLPKTDLVDPLFIQLSQEEMDQFDEVMESYGLEGRHLRATFVRRILTWYFEKGWLA